MAVEGRKRAFWVRLSSYWAVTRKRWQSRDRNSRHVTPVIECDPEVTSFHRESPGSDCIRPELVLRVHLSSCRAVTCRKWQSHDKK